MKIKISKTKWLEFNFTGKPDDDLWNTFWSVRLARRFFPDSKFSLLERCVSDYPDTPEGLTK